MKKMKALFFAITFILIFTTRSFALENCSNGIVTILFLGNSFTFTNDLPAMLTKIASTDLHATRCLATSSFTQGGVHLSQLWTNPEAQARLIEKKWTYVILQEYSSWAFAPELIEETRQSVATWSAAAKKLSAQPILFQTWADQDGSSRMTDPNHVLYGQTMVAANAIIEKQSAAIASNAGIPVVPVGSYWKYAISMQNMPNLYAADKTHPSTAGTYLSALLFYKYLTQNSLDGISYIPQGLTQEQAGLLLAVAKAK